MTTLPAGWKLVPATITLDMSIAFAEAWFSKVRCIDDAEMQDAYAAMIAAAPAAGDAPSLTELNADLIDILGRPNFTCIRIAQLLRLSGVEIDKKAEAEQATVIHYLLGFYLTHGSQWAEKAGEDIERLRLAAIAAQQGKGGAEC